MKYKLNLQVLLPGDIILVGYNDERSREIQRRTECEYSHAMLFWYDSIIHASDIVMTENPSRLVFDEDEKVCILRLKEEYHQELRIGMLINYARSFVGTFYDQKALHALEKGREPLYRKNRQMCAKFVAQCFGYVCCDFVEDYETCTPKDILNSNLLEKVENPLVLATESDILFANDYENNLPLRQFSAIRDILISFKRSFPQEDVVTLNQVEEFVGRNPDKSKTVLDLFRKTEYFQLVDIEKENNPYLYDMDLFLEEYKENSSIQACKIRDSSQRIVDEKENDISEYQNRIKLIGDLEYYRAMIDLRQRIISNAKERIRVADQVCEKNHIVKIKYPWL